MSAGPLVVELFLVFAMTAFLLHRYGNWRRQHLIVSVSVLVGWYFAFVIVFLLPLDVALTFFRSCAGKHASERPAVNNETVQAMLGAGDNNLSDLCVRPGSYVHNQVLVYLWRVVYWTSQALTWLVLPIMQSYSNAGDFTALGKIKTALYENAIYYGSYLLVFSVLLIYVAAKGISIDAQNLKTIGIAASNTWGLFLLILLLGYGLVEVPRQVWQTGAQGYRLQKIYFDLEKLAAEKNDAEEGVKEAWRDSQDTLNTLRPGHPFRARAEIIISKFPEEVTKQLTRRGSRTTAGGESSFRDTDAANLTSTSEKSLVRLHRRVIKSLLNQHRTQAQWRATLDRALHLEEVAKNENNPPGSRLFLRSFRADLSLLHQTVCTPMIEWYWECFVKRPLLKCVSVLLMAMSAFIVWSECTFFVVQPVLSLAAIFVFSAGKNYDYAYIEFSSILVIAYMCVCAYYTVFKLRIYRYYHLDPHHQTDENSLLFSAILLCRLTPPLCLNFLGMIHMDNHVTRDALVGGFQTAFTDIMGHLDVISFVSRGFNIYFPILVLLLCLGTYFRLGTRCLHQLGIDQFVGDDEMTGEMVQGGKALVQNERNRMQRESNRETREEYIRDSGRSPMGRGFAQRMEGVGRRSSDKTPIVPEMEQTDFSSSSAYDNYRIDSNRSPPPFPRRLDQSPPKGIFDDL